MRRKGAVNIINMTVSEAIQQLADLRDDRESFINNDDPENDHIYLSDMAAIDVAVATMAKYEMAIGERKGYWCGSVCSTCGTSVSGWYDYTYCPFCGSRNIETTGDNQAERKSVAQSISNEQFEKALKENVQIICNAYNEWRSKENKKLFEKVEALRKQIDEMRNSNSEIYYERLLQHNDMPRRCGDIETDESENNNAKN